MFSHEREAKVTLRRQKTRIRTPSPDEQDMELIREAKKAVSFGADFIEEYQQSITKDDFNSQKKRGIARVTLENQEKREEDA